VSVDASTFCRQVNEATVVRVLAEHPHWSLADLANHLECGGPLADALGAVTIDALLRYADPYRAERERAKRLVGPELDALVLAVVRKMERGWFRSRKIRAVLGGPRCKVQYALARLADAGHLERCGTTSNTLYRVRQPDRSDAS
jgi:hypothetical protein